MNTYTKKQINEIVDENYVHASVLYHFGIRFYDYYGKTLEQVCKERQLNVKQVISRLESVNIQSQALDLTLSSYPIDIIIAYLKHTHYLFIKQRLPYLAKLIENFPEQYSKNIAKDLKFIFPLFVEDLIQHIYEEEDTLFSYITSLNHALTQPSYPLNKLYLQMERNSIQNFALEHDIDDDEMKGIRDITHNYSLKETNDLHLRVIYAELQHFEQELCTHAKIENEILFPKALMLEKEVKKMVTAKSSMN